VDQPYGMPISIAEAMSHGCTVVARRRPGAAEYVGPDEVLYDTVDEAVAFIQATTRWTDAAWVRAARRATDWSYARYADLNVLPPLIEEFCRLHLARSDGRTRAASSL
jgi:glycosyltransferase involved in cell wall biosynthesis